MNKPEPLNDKWKPLGYGKTKIFMKRDVKSAVEWLKKRLMKDDLYVDLALIEERINEAFEDVMK